MPNKKKNRVGETVLTSYGKMTIIRYGGYNDIDVKFEDGTIVKNRTYRCFKRGMISHPNYYLANRLGETKIASCGMKMTIIRYNTATDIDVQFGDGTIVTHKEYASFKKGEIKNPNYDPYASKVGEETMSSCGMIMEIIRYNNSNDIDVKFEDGTVVTHKRYGAFKKGEIKNPNYDPYVNRIGEEIIANCGQKMEIIKYNSYEDIDVKFEDGTIATHKRYGAFKKGEIKNPSCEIKPVNLRAKLKHEGETSINSFGLKMTIIRYNTNTDIDVQFEDGTIVKNKSYNKFIHGTIQNPNNNSHTNRLGKVTMSSCGLKMKIIEYKNYNDIDIRFEDGSIVSHKGYGVFSKGSIAHPILSAKQQCIFKNIIARYSWSENGKVYYLCRCRKCGEEAIWTPQDMILHEEKCRNTSITRG